MTNDSACCAQSSDMLYTSLGFDVCAKAVSNSPTTNKNSMVLLKQYNLPCLQKYTTGNRTENWLGIFIINLNKKSNTKMFAGFIVIINTVNLSISVIPYMASCRPPKISATSATELPTTPLNSFKNRFVAKRYKGIEALGLARLGKISFNWFLVSF